LRLLFIVDSFASGGAQRQMVQLAVGLKQRQHEVEFFIYYPQYTHFRAEVEGANIPIHEHYKTSRFSLSVVLALIQQIRQVDYDGILSFLTTPNIYAEIAHLQDHCPFLVVSERNIFPKQVTPKTWLVRQMHRIADHVTVNSHHQREKLLDAAPWLAHKITTIYNGVDLDSFSPANRWQTSPDSVPHFLTIGSVVPRKNPRLLVEALITLRDKYGYLPKISWVGKVQRAKHSQEAYYQSVERLKSAGLESSWRWLGERLDIPELLRSHDALIHAGIQEGLPNVVCEALSCGTPVLVSNVLEHPRLVQHGASGFLFDPCAPYDLAAKMKQFVEMPMIDKHRMGQAGRVFAEKNLSLSQYITNYEQLFTGLMR
jgi:glycosyltransferase involved in cell wall biosynthesis